MIVVKIDQGEEFRRYQMPVSVRGAVGQIIGESPVKVSVERKASMSPSSEDSLRHRRERSLVLQLWKSFSQLVS